MKKYLPLRSLTSSFIVAAGFVLLPVSAVYATETGAHTTPTTTDSTTTTKPSTESTAKSTTAAQTTADTLAQRLANVIAKGDQEIARRQATLATLNAKITAATHLTDSNKAALSSQVSAESAGLTALKTKLDSEKTLDAAHADAKAILDGYRVYALIVPKIALIRTADSEQATAARLTALAAKLQTRITASSKASDLQTTLNDMVAHVNTAQTTASAVEAKVVNLQPTDYNSDHAILGGDRDQLKTAHTAIQAAITDAKTIIAALKTTR
jgi:hypothetical protein